jgi:hypothetical protein
MSRRAHHDVQDHVTGREWPSASALMPAAMLSSVTTVADVEKRSPATSVGDWPETLPALEAIGYQGRLAMECGLSGPGDQVLAKVAKLLTR